MAVYPIDPMYYAGSIKNALQSAGVITNLYYDGSLSSNNGYTVIFSTPYSNKVIKVDYGFSIWIGDAYSSGTNITNSMQVSNGAGGTFMYGGIVVTPNLIGFLNKDSGNQFGCLFGKISNTNNDFMVLGFNTHSNYSNTCRCRNTTIGADMYPLVLKGSPIRGSDGSWYITDWIFKDVNNLLLTGTMTGTKVIMRPRNTEAYDVYGNDVVANVGYIQNTTNVDCCVLISNGNV